MTTEKQLNNSLCIVTWVFLSLASWLALLTQSQATPWTCRAAPSGTVYGLLPFPEHDSGSCYSLTTALCGGLDENSLHRLLCLTTWSPGGGAVREGLEVGALLGVLLGVGFEISKDISS